MALIFTTTKFLPLLLLAVWGLHTVSGKPERRERHITREDSSSHRPQSIDLPSSSAIPKLTFSNNEFTSEPRRKVSHRLMGGHMRAEVRTEPPKVSKIDNSDESDEASWDDGLILSSAGNGKEKKPNRSDDDDEKKTLSQQVKEGKYGLIQNEIYPQKPKRPGIISYLSNPEVPRDNAKNLGGLDEEEIWLAENHVLVLRGGNFPDHETDNQQKIVNTDDWTPIDDYKAPKRQVKIPQRPKVPPPFPVQLSDNGPLQIIGVNGSSVDGASSKDYENDSSYGKGFLPGDGPFFTSSKNDSLVDSTKERGDDKNGANNGHVPPPSGVIGPFYPALPPGAVFVVPPGNASDYDEDDQSIYYPPPYSFTYKQDNSTPVPPGPLVPGIILPPPPDFFSGVEEKKSTSKIHHTKYPKRPSTTIRPRVTPTSYNPPRKSSSKPIKNISTLNRGEFTNAKQSTRSSLTMKPANRIKYKNTTSRSTLRPIRVQETPLPEVEATTPRGDDSSTREITDIDTTRPNSVSDRFNEKIRPSSKNRWTSNVSSKPVPLVSYYASSTPSTIDESVVTTRAQSTSGNQASYYFYEEAKDETVTTPNPTVYYRATTEAPYYNVRDETKKSYYESPVTTTRSTKDYGVELLEPVPKTSSRYQYTNSAPATDVISSRVQGQRMLADSSPLYYEDVTVSPQNYYTTDKPRNYPQRQQETNRYDYEKSTKPKPIYQYSYESADYRKRDEATNYYKPESQRQSYHKQDSARPTVRPESFDEWRDERLDNGQYDYEAETSPEQSIPPLIEEQQRYEERRPVVDYPSSTQRPVIAVTANPHHAYYTKQDEQLLDDVTREYFTNFGKKIHGHQILPSTTPIYGKTSVTPRPNYQRVNSYDYEGVGATASHKTPMVNVHYGDHTQRPYSLQSDTRVNYKEPLPPVNPDSEWIPGFNPKERLNVPLANYRSQQTRLENQDYVQQNLAVQRQSTIRDYDQQRIVQQANPSPTSYVPYAGGLRHEVPRHYPNGPISLAGDTDVNYRDPRPPNNPDAEFIDPGAIRDNGSGDKASYFAYRLPGDSGHFYFLTPQAISQRQDGNGGYLYPRPRGTRLSRQRRRGAGNN